MHRPTRAFTLIEMLVVMGIIGVLVALLFPAIRGAQLAAERADAERLAVTVEGAIKAFYNEYGRYPLQGTAGSSDPKTDKYYLEVEVDYTNLIAALRGIKASENPKGFPFLDVSDKKLGEYGTHKGVLLDPWDTPLRIWADWSNNNEIDTTPKGNPYGLIKGRPALVWSAGPDRKDGDAALNDKNTNRFDNVTSWGD